MTTQALLFTDVVDSTLLVERVGDARAAQLWADHDHRARALLAQHGGREIDRSDGFFMLFDAAIDAARFALDYHRVLAELGVAARVGLHVGSVTLRENTPDEIARGAKPVEVEGLAKPFAARVMALALGGQTLLSADARTALDALPDGTEIDSHGHYRMKGVEAPVAVFELGVRGRAALTPPADTDKAYRVLRDGELWRPVREVRHNLPAERDAFVGRSAELRSLAQRLDAGARLITVFGPGGSGKTRFARRYARGWLGNWPGGVYFCDLSEAKSLDGVLNVVAVALDVPLGKGDPGQQLGHAIAGRGRCLLILDNFEQVVGHASPTLHRWVDRAGDTAFIVTSRERLHVPGEEVLPLGPLPVANEAIELFAARARAQKPDFEMNAASRTAVGRIVSQLDGLPLAIELAAARVRVLSPEQIVERMDDRFALLAGARGVAARQATLRAAIDWSWELLAPWEQAALAQCSVFEGGFTLQAAEAVLELSAWPDAPPALDAIQSLVDKSLLRAWFAGERGRLDLEEPYFGMYLSIHEYAAERLVAVGAVAHRAALERHARHFAGFGTDASLDALKRHGGVRRSHVLARELENLIAACQRAVALGSGEIAVATYRAAWQVLDLQGPYTPGIELGGPVVNLVEGHASKCAVALATRGTAAGRAGRQQEAQAWLLRALALAREAGDRRCEGLVLSELGPLCSGHGQAEEQSCYEQALVVHRELGNRIEEGIVLGYLGNVFCNRGLMEPALANYEAALAIHRETGNRRSEGLVLGNLGTLFTDWGRMEEGRVHGEAALAIAREIGSRREEGVALANLGVIQGVLGCVDEACASIEAGLAIAREIGDRRSEGIAIGNLGDLHVEQGRLNEGRVELEAALAIAREVGHRRHEGAALGSVGGVLIRLGHFDAARDALRAGEALLREIGDPLDLAALLCLRGLAQIAAGDLDGARAAQTEAERLAAQARVEPGSSVDQEIARLREALAGVAL